MSLGLNYFTEIDGSVYNCREGANGSFNKDNARLIWAGGRFRLEQREMDTRKDYYYVIPKDPKKDLERMATDVEVVFWKNYIKEMDSHVITQFHSGN